jgi:hypothetical protein
VIPLGQEGQFHREGVPLRILMEIREKGILSNPPSTRVAFHSVARRLAKGVLPAPIRPSMAIYL